MKIKNKNKTREKNVTPCRSVVARASTHRLESRELKFPASTAI